MRKFIANFNVHGWMGKTHALLSIMLLCICLLIPINIFKETIWLLKDNLVFFIIGVIVTAGGSLLPDLDSVQSAAKSTLGFMGDMTTTFMRSIGDIMYRIVHLKRDRKSLHFPHRYFWHTLIAAIGILCMFWFGLPTGDKKIIDEVKETSVLDFLQDHVILLFFILFLFMAILCGSDMIMNKVIKFFKLPKALNYISPLAMCGYLFAIDYTHLRILGICIGLGYLFHCIEDCFADSGVPLLWPIPIKKQCWHRIKFFVTCSTVNKDKTGGLANTIIDIVVLVIDIGLIALILMKGSII